MAHEITMPKLSDTMTEGRLISWKKNVGERVERGDIIAEVETDKATMELEAFTSGTLLETVVKPDETVPVGTVMAIIGEVGEPAHISGDKKESSPPEPEMPQPPPAEPVPEKGKNAEPAPEGDRVEEEKASPMVRRLARERGLDLQRISGSGPDGRILREDLELFLKEGETQTGSQDEGDIPLSHPEARVDSSQEASSGESRPLSRMRAAIAATVTRSWQETPLFTVTVSIDMGEAEEVRRELKASGTVVSINDMIVRGVALTLQKYPQANNSFTGNRIVVNSSINIGLVVSLEDGLLIPVIRECQGLTLQQVSARSRELIEKAMGGTISEADMSGGTFTISNMGMFGVVEFMALIYPPQGAILAVGGVRDEAVVKNGQIVAARTMRVTLSVDHRLMDGAYAARFLQELKRVLENPVSLLV